jgi:hypothetical protein
MAGSQLEIGKITEIQMSIYNGQQPAETGHWTSRNRRLKAPFQTCGKLTLC